jgi:hypothetical protein
MSPRKQTVDQQDDVDDEDGTVEEEARQTDLKLHRRRADEVALGGMSVADQEEQADDREER